MKLRHALTAAALVIGSLGSVAPPVSAADVSDFRGLWYAEDHVDDSNTYLYVGRRGRVVLFDDAAFVCDGAPAIAISRRGTVTGDRLSVDYRIRCFNGISVPDFATYLQVEADGTLTSEPDATGFDTYARL